MIVLNLHSHDCFKLHSHAVMSRLLIHWSIFLKLFKTNIKINTREVFIRTCKISRGESNSKS